MSDFKFSCPKCGQHIACDTSNAGMQLPCPGCETILTVPTPAPAVPPPTAPGKLSINKSTAAHNAAAPAAAAHAASAANWRQQPKAPSAAAPAKNNKGLIWGSVLGGVLLLAVVVYFGFILPKQQKAEAEAKAKQQQEEADRQAAEKKRQAEEAEKKKLLRAVWTMDLSNVKIPDRPASGKLNGEAFKVEKAFFQAGTLTLRQESGTSSQFVLTPVKVGETNYAITVNDTGGLPGVILNWKEEPPARPGSEKFYKGYALKLELKPSGDGAIAGKIYLCVPDDSQSFVAGNFEAVPKTVTPAGARPPAAGAAAAPRPPRKKIPIPIPPPAQ